MLTRQELRQRIDAILEDAPLLWLDMVYWFLLGLGSGPKVNK